MVNNDFDIDNANVEYINGNPYYILPEGTTIYHGSNKLFNENMVTFFAFKKKNSEQYGRVKTFTTN